MEGLSSTALKYLNKISPTNYNKPKPPGNSTCFNSFPSSISSSQTILTSKNQSNSTVLRQDDFKVSEIGDFMPPRFSAFPFPKYSLTSALKIPAKYENVNNSTVFSTTFNQFANQRQEKIVNRKSKTFQAPSAIASSYHIPMEYNNYTDQNSLKFSTSKSAYQTSPNYRLPPSHIIEQSPLSSPSSGVGINKTYLIKKSHMFSNNSDISFTSCFSDYEEPKVKRRKNSYESDFFESVVPNISKTSDNTNQLFDSIANTDFTSQRNDTEMKYSKSDVPKDQLMSSFFTCNEDASISEDNISLKSKSDVHNTVITIESSFVSNKPPPPTPQQTEDIVVSIDFGTFKKDKIDTYYSGKISEVKTLPLIDRKNVDSNKIKELFKVICVKREPDVIEIGNKEEKLQDDVNFDDEIDDPLYEYEESFINSRNFTTSTPERVNKFIKEEPVDEQLSSLFDSGVVNVPESNDNWSHISHVSASVPLDDLSNYQFSLNSILQITQKDVDECITRRTDKSERIDKLLTIIQEENLMDESLLPVNADKSIAENRRSVIMTQIEGIIQVLLQSLAKGKKITLKIQKVKDFKDCEVNNAVLSQKLTKIAMKTLSITNKSTARTFSICTTLLCEIYKMLSKNISCTKRELYYRDTALFMNQQTVDRAINDICILLNVFQWELGILTTSKGLVAGDLKMIIGEYEIEIDCSKSPCAVPQNPSDIKNLISNADYVIIVEKDTVFTRLLQGKLFDKIKSKVILVTAKGYPDVNTRVLLKRIETDLHIPIYILVDADPHGIEIMCTYKFGSLQLVQNSEQLAVSSIEWIGIYPSDIETLNITHTKMTAGELKKVDELLTRPYMYPELQRELNHLKSREYKAEIEGIYDISVDYLIKDYIPQKIRAIDEPFHFILRGIHGDCVNLEF